MVSSKDGKDDSIKKKHAGTSQKAQKGSDFSKLLVPTDWCCGHKHWIWGTEYQPDWTSDCSLLVCAFANTPKFRQIQEDNGTIALFVWLISHQLTVLFSQNKPATSNQPAVFFSQNKPAPTISHQPNEQAVSQRLILSYCRSCEFLVNLLQATFLFPCTFRASE
jgi:DNA-repair protein XRCC1